MPNGGPTPDCVHCKYFTGKPFVESEPYCNHHHIKLAYIIRAFCAAYVDPEPDEKGDWLDQMLGNREQLAADWMYLWVELDRNEVRFVHVPLVAITDYAGWTSERFLDEMVKLYDQYRN
ncbi:MAG: hypothetical protein H7Y11_01420 [Armatimonadetes bacterium]|nr:hypothetical protein [Anaerolineae bacterium]